MLGDVEPLPPAALNISAGFRIHDGRGRGAGGYDDERFAPPDEAEQASRHTFDILVRPKELTDRLQLSSILAELRNFTAKFLFILIDSLGEKRPAHGREREIADSDQRQAKHKLS